MLGARIESALRKSHLPPKTQRQWERRAAVAVPGLIPRHRRLNRDPGRAEPGGSRGHGGPSGSQWEPGPWGAGWGVGHGEPWGGPWKLGQRSGQGPRREQVGGWAGGWAGWGPWGGAGYRSWVGVDRSQGGEGGVWTGSGVVGVVGAWGAGDVWGSGGSRGIRRDWRAGHGGRAGGGWVGLRPGEATGRALGSPGSGLPAPGVSERAGPEFRHRQPHLFRFRFGSFTLGASRPNVSQRCLYQRWICVPLAQSLFTHNDAASQETRNVA